MNQVDVLPVDSNRSTVPPAAGAKPIDAFLSYSREDVHAARRLQSRLQSFAKPWYALKRLNVFRDESHLSGTALRPSLERALDRSRYLLLLASPASAKSNWVDRELSRWFARGARPIIIVLASGTIAWSDRDADFDWDVTDALPKILRGKLSAEPRWLDLSGVGDFSSPEARLKLESVVADAGCQLIGAPKDLLVGEDVRQHNRLIFLRRLAIALLTTLLVVAVALGTVAYLKFRQSEERLKNAFEMAVDSLTTIEDLRSIPAAEEAREKLSASLNRALIDLQAGLAKDDRRVISRNARVLAFEGEDALQRGDLPEAARKLNAAQQLYLDPRWRNDSWALSGLGDVDDRLARLAEMRQDPAGAVRAEQEAVHTAEVVRDHDPNDINRGQLATSYDNLGVVLGRTGDLDGSEKYHHLALPIVEELFAKDPSLPRRDDLVRSYVMLSQLAHERAQPAAELDWLRKAEAKLLPATDPGSVQLANISIEIAMRMAMHPSASIDDRSKACTHGLADSDALVASNRTDLPSRVLRARLLAPCSLFAAMAHDQTRAQQLVTEGLADMQAVLTLEPDYEEARKAQELLQTASTVK